MVTTFELWDIVLKPTFLVTFLIVLGGFLPVLYSLRETYLQNDDADEE